MTSSNIILIFVACVLTMPVVLKAEETYIVQVNPDGSFTPQRVDIRDGDTVEWRFAARTDSIVPIDNPTGGPGGCQPYKPYAPADPNEFTGPLPRAASGIFTLSPDGTGLAERTLTPQQAANFPPDVEPVHFDDLYLVPQGKDYATMNSTWESPNVTGVFIRLRWNTIQPNGPDHFDWTVMDREIEKAVTNGKLYSLSFKAGALGTPDWIFDPVVAGTRAVPPVTLQDHGGADGPQCGQEMTLGSPANANYRALYFALWRAAAERIRARNAWYRALAYVKPSGANLHSHENRLPNACDEGCPCNPEIWAKDGEYTPTALYEFYRQQTALLAAEFPDKEMCYQLIQAGFPRVSDLGAYEGQTPRPAQNSLPGVTEQTEEILKQGWAKHGMRFVVAHNGLGPRPQDQPNPKPPCQHEGVHPVQPPFAQAGSGCPNRFVLEASVRGSITGFQTENSGKGVGSPGELESTFLNAFNNSDAIYVEIYENRFWEAERLTGAMADPIGTWAERFHDRRRTMLPALPDPLPSVHRHTFTRTTASRTESQRLYYTHGAKGCSGDPALIGEIAILPDVGLVELRIVSARRVAPQTVRLEMEGTAGTTVRIERSQNLSSWQTLTEVPNPDGRIAVDDETAAAGQGFYRGVLLNR